MKHGRTYNQEPTLRLVRAPEPMRGTHWHPLSHVEPYYGRNPKQLSLDELRDHLSGGNARPKPIAVQSPYSRYDYNHHFDIDPQTLAVVSKGVGRIAAQSRAKLAPLSVVHRGVRIEGNVSVGPKTEVMPYATLHQGVSVDGGSVVGKRARIYPHAAVADDVYIGPSNVFGACSSAQTGTVTHKNHTVGSETEIGLYYVGGQGTRIGSRVTAEDGVRVGRYCRIYDRVYLADGSTVMPYSVVNQGAVIGAGATVGERGAVVSMGWVPADGTVEGPNGGADSLRMGRIFEALNLMDAIEGLE